MTKQLNFHAPTHKQLGLPEINIQPISTNGSSSFNDPAFAGNKTLPIHRWVPWIAGFSSDFVRDVLERYANGNHHDPKRKDRIFSKL